MTARIALTCLLACLLCCCSRSSCAQSKESYRETIPALQTELNLRIKQLGDSILLIHMDRQMNRFLVQTHEIYLNVLWVNAPVDYRIIRANRNEVVLECAFLGNKIVGNQLRFVRIGAHMELKTITEFQTLGSGAMDRYRVPVLRTKLRDKVVFRLADAD